jgi:Fic family protein
MTDLSTQTAAKKAELDPLRPLAPAGLRNLERVYDLELTYTSNAIEGNTLTAAETQLVIEQGITIGGKPLKDHLEAIDHHEAMLYVRAIAKNTAPLTEFDVRTLHSLVLKRADPGIAGRYADQGRFVLTETGRRAFPSPAEVPALMGAFAGWLNAEPDTPDTAFTAHRRLVTIHPLNDGNGRTARLLMNLILIRGGWPPVSIRPVDRPAYIAAIDDAEAFGRFLYERLDVALTDYLDAIRQALPPNP